MKKFLVVLLSLGLIAGISATASALDVKFSGSYQVEGAFESNAYQSGSDHKGFFGGDTSRAAVWQRFRLQPVFKVAEGLSMTFRIDALEKQWGNTAWRGGTADDFTNSRRQTTTVVPARAAGQKTQENIEFERSYVTFATAVGVFDVGYQMVGRWGTGFNDWENTGARIKYTTKVGPVALLAIWDKVYDSDSLVQGSTYGSTYNKVDADSDGYYLAAIYSGKGIEGGLLYKYTFSSNTRPTANVRTKLMSLSPYVKAKFGPVALEGELSYVWGKAAEFDSGTGDVNADALGGYLKVQTNLGPAYFGALATYIQGDNLSDATKKKGGLLNAKGVNPALIMMGDDYLPDIFPIGNAYDDGNFASPKAAVGGLVMFNVFGGFNPTPKLNLEMGFTSASFAVKPRFGNTKTGVEYVSKNIGMELDVTATYKLYDNLSYMVGAGYLFTGDAFKGTNSNATIGNDYMVMNRLALSF